MTSTQSKSFNCKVFSNLKMKNFNLRICFKNFRYFDQVEIDEIEVEISNVEENILETICYTPEGCESLSWPMGTPPPFKPSSRHEVIRFDHFNSSHVFLGTDFDVVNLFTGK